MEASALKAAGVDVIRAALASRNRKTTLPACARDCGVSASDLDAFISSRLTLPPQVLQALARRLFDAELTGAGMLRPAVRQEPDASTVP